MVWGGGVMRQCGVLWEEGALVLKRILEDILQPGSVLAALSCQACPLQSGFGTRWFGGPKAGPPTPSLLQGHPHLLPQLPRLSSFAP